MSQAGEIDVVGNNPQIVTQVDADTGSAVAIGNVLNIVGVNGISTSASGNTVTIDGAGIGADVTLTADDSNTLTSNAFNLFGQPAGVIPIMETLIAGGDFFFENNAWETPYIIDSVTTSGLKATFSTIQSALDQAVLDGMSFSNPKKFILRPSSAPYVENLAIPAGAFFYSAGIDSDPQSIPSFVTVQGNHTLADVCLVSSQGIQWTCSTGDLFTSGSTVLILSASNSNFYNSGSGQIIQASTGMSFVNLHDNQFSTGAPFSPTITFGDLNYSDIKNCTFNNTGIQVNSGILRLSNCRSVGEVNLAGTVIARNVEFNGDTNSCVYGTGAGTFVECGFTNNNSGGSFYGIDLSGSVSLVNGYLTGSSLPIDFVSPTTPLATNFVTVGNTLKAVRSAADVVGSVGVNYIGITNTAAPRSVVINPGPVDYQIFVVDESGGAGTNNITVSTFGGVGLINGAATFVISQNYGSALFHYNGTDWFVSSSAKEGSPGVTSVTGTANRITSTGGATSVIDIASTYVGQTSITTLGTIGTGTWQGTAVGATFGGTAQTSWTTGDLLYASAANTLAKRAVGSTNNLLTVTGGVPAWTATPSVTSITLSGGTALSNYTEGTFTPTLTGGTVPGTTVYLVQAGFYTRIGQSVLVSMVMNITSATGTGDVVIGGLPFNINVNTAPTGSVYISGAWPWPASRSYLVFTGNGSASTGLVYACGASATAVTYKMSNSALTISISFQYII